MIFLSLHFHGLEDMSLSNIFVFLAKGLIKFNQITMLLHIWKNITINIGERYNRDGYLDFIKKQTTNLRIKEIDLTIVTHHPWDSASSTTMTPPCCRTSMCHTHLHIRSLMWAPEAKMLRMNITALLSVYGSIKEHSPYILSNAAK